MDRHTLMIKSAGILLALSLVSGLTRAAETPHVPLTDDLAHSAATAASGNRLLVLLVSREDCGFCHLLKRNVLNPMIMSGEYQDQVVFREILIDAGNRLTDFSGNHRSAYEFADELGIQLTPTLLFLAPTGRELEERMVGVQTLEMLYFYVDNAISKALKRLVAPTAEPGGAAESEL